MSVHSTCIICLEVDFNEENIKTLIKKGQEIGFMYLAKEKYEESKTINYFSVDQATHHIILARTSKKNDTNFPKSLEVNFQDTVFTLAFYEENTCLCVNLFPIDTVWKKNFKNDKYFDFGHYMTLLIDFCEDFPIMKISTETE